MIKAVGNITGHIRTVQNIKGKINNATVKIYPELEDLEITPLPQEQNFKSSKYGYDNVKVKAVESEEISITPTTTEQIKEGMYNKVTVAGDSNLVADNIREGTSIFGVNGNAKTMDIKITSGAYLFYENARTDYINELLALCTNISSTTSMFRSCSLTNLDLKNIDMSKVRNSSSMFYFASSIVELDMSGCDMGQNQNTTQMFSYTSNLETLKSFKNMGKGFVNKSSNASYYKLDLSSCKKLTYESLIDLITNGLYDLNLTYDVANGGTLYTQQLVLGSTNMAKLTAEEIAIATNKGWVVS